MAAGWFGALVLGLGGTTLPEPSGIQRISGVLQGHWHHAVVVDPAMAAVEWDVHLADRLTPPRRLAEEAQAEAAITGTFFAYESQQPVADVLTRSALRRFGHRGTAVRFMPDGGMDLQDVPFGQAKDWGGAVAGVRGAVRILRDGQVCPDPRGQGFTDPAIWGRAARTGLARTEDGRILMAATAARVTLSRFANALKEWGAVDAVSLDGGGSTMLAYQGRMVVPTSRRLCNLIVVRRTAW
ncbi:MAG: phosphodiester glycosidase family protein [Fimbriimonadaceae bacterium]|nr:phosphodiester glycosidase family protein [Fimbriimonadaceae bacterium]